MDVPVVQAGMGGVAGPQLAGAVASAGGLGTLALMSPAALREAVGSVRDQAPGRAVAVNLLMPFVRRGHVTACLENRVDVAVLFCGGDRQLVSQLHAGRVCVLIQVGTENEARDAIEWGADGLIAQGREAGGHLLGTRPALEFLPRAKQVAGGRPVLLAGGMATGADTRAALDSGAAAAVAGTRFLLTHESLALPAYQERVLEADSTCETMLFGLGWPARHRVVPNAALRRWTGPDEATRKIPAALNELTRWTTRFASVDEGEALGRMQRARLPFFTPVAPVKGMPDSSVESTALYAGESALRMSSVMRAADAVRELAG